MYEVTKNKAFYSTLRALRMLRLYPKRKEGASFYLHMVRMALEKGLSFIVVVGLCMMHLGNAWGNGKIDKSEDFAVMCGGLGTCITNLLFGCKSRNWSTFFLRINDFRKFGTPATYKNTIDSLNFYSMSYFWYCTIGMGVYATVTVYESKECRTINEQYGLHDICWSVTPAWLPWKQIPGYFKVIIFIMQYIGAFHLTASAALICFLTWEATEVLLTHVSHLKHHLMEVFDDMDDVTQRLRTLVEYQKFIFSVADQLNRLVQATVGHVSLVAALVFGCIGNQIFKSKPLGASVFLTGWVIAMFMICHAGQKMRDESLSVADTIYFSEWYHGTVQQKKSIAFMMARCQKPIFFDALPFGTLNYPLFVMIIKTSYSYLTLLNQST